WICNTEENKRNQRDARDAVSFETVRARANRVARVITRAVGDYAGVTRVVFLDLEDDLHQVGTDVGDLREDTAGDAQRSRAQRLADRKTDEAWSRVIGRDEQQYAEHDQQLDADQHHAYAHAGL